MIAELLCAWFAGVVLGWRLSHQRPADRAVPGGGHRPAFDWARETDL